MTDAKRKPAFASRIAAVALALVLVLAIASGYLYWWRQEHYVSQPVTVFVDLRKQAATSSFTEEGMSEGYVAFCSRFSENPVGFPGHGFVLWSNRWPPPKLALCDTSGFYPSQYFDQFVALLKPVKGVFVKEPLSEDQECLEYSLVAIVDSSIYKRSLAVRDEWKKRAKFQLYSSDCVNFVDAIAASVGLQRPDRARLFPQDYVSRLRDLNPAAKTN